MGRVVTILIAIGLTGLIAACGGGDSSSPPATSTTASTGGAVSSPAVPAASGEATRAPATSTTTTTTAQTGGSSGVLDACSLLTADQVSDAVGKTVGEGKPARPTAAQASACEWDSADSSAGVFIEILARNGKSWYEAVNFDHDKEEIDGIGDEALFDSIGVLDVLDGDTFVSVQVILFFSDVDDLTAARELAEQILDKLP